MAKGKDTQEPQAPQAPKTAHQVMAQANKKLQEGKHRKKALMKKYKEEEKVPMYLSPMYRPYVGNVMPVSINGIKIYFKVDGSTQLVPKTFADEIANRRIQIDAILTKQSRMADVQANAEGTPGELKMF